LGGRFGQLIDMYVVFLKLFTINPTLITLQRPCNEKREFFHVFTGVMRYNFLLFISTFPILVLAGRFQIYFSDGSVINSTNNFRDQYLRSIYCRYTPNELKEKLPSVENDLNSTRVINTLSELTIPINYKIPTSLKRASAGYYYKSRLPSQKFIPIKIERDFHSAFLKLDSERQSAIKIYSFCRYSIFFTGINEITKCLCGPFEMTISEYLNQEERVPYPSIQDNLLDISQLLQEFKESEFQGNKIPTLENALVVARNATTGKLEFKIIIHALIGCNIRMFITEFKNFCTTVTSEMQNIYTVARNVSFDHMFSDENTANWASLKHFLNDAPLNSNVIEMEGFPALNESESEGNTSYIQLTTVPMEEIASFGMQNFNLPSAFSSFVSETFEKEVEISDEILEKTEYLSTDLEIPPLDLEFWKELLEEGSTLFKQIPLYDDNQTEDTGNFLNHPLNVPNDLNSRKSAYSPS
jgi:hypothetical protein